MKRRGNEIWTSYWILHHDISPANEELPVKLSLYGPELNY